MRLGCDQLQQSIQLKIKPVEILDFDQYAQRPRRYGNNSIWATRIQSGFECIVADTAFCFFPIVEST